MNPFLLYYLWLFQFALRNWTFKDTFEFLIGAIWTEKMLFWRMNFFRAHLLYCLMALSDVDTIKSNRFFTIAYLNLEICFLAFPCSLLLNFCPPFNAWASLRKDYTRFCDQPFKKFRTPALNACTYNQILFSNFCACESRFLGEEINKKAIWNRQNYSSFTEF